MTVGMPENVFVVQVQRLRVVTSVVIQALKQTEVVLILSPGRVSSEIFMCTYQIYVCQWGVLARMTVHITHTWLVSGTFALLARAGLRVFGHTFTENACEFLNGVFLGGLQSESGENGSWKFSKRHSVPKTVCHLRLSFENIFSFRLPFVSRARGAQYPIILLGSFTCFLRSLSPFIILKSFFVNAFLPSIP